MSGGRRRIGALAVAGSLCGVFLVVASALAAQGDTTLVSRQSASAGGGSGNGFSQRPAISASGRIVAFESGATTLADADGPGRDVYARDATTQETSLVSRRSGAGGTPGDQSSEEPAISADGRFVTFQSEADNLAGAANDAVDNIFVRDLERNRTILVSRRSAAAGGKGGNGDSTTPSISPDGRFVAFRSNAANLSGADAHEQGTGDLYTDVFIRDLKRKRTILVSRRSGPRGKGGNEASFAPSVSAGGRYVAFASRAENLSGADVTSQDIFVRDMKRNRTILVSRRSAAAGGEGADDTSGAPSISANGRHVAFASEADNLAGAANGDFNNIFVRDLKRKRTLLASRQSASVGGQGANDDSLIPSISDDGRFVAFHSLADNLSDDDDDAFQNVVVRALNAKQTTAASLASNGDPANGDSFGAAISANGRFVAFGSDAANLSDADAHDIVLGDLHTDVFRHDLLGP